MTAAADHILKPKTSSRFLRRALPYLLSLPALLVCIGILIPFFTAVYYSLLRFRLNLPALKGFIWFDNYINFLSDAAFWNTVKVSLVYAGLTVGVELLLGLGIALLLQKPTRFNNIASILLLLPLMTAPALAFTIRQTNPPIKWRPYDPVFVEQARAQGKTVVLEFTAAWCSNCIAVETSVATISSKSSPCSTTLISATGYLACSSRSTRWSRMSGSASAVTASLK